MISRSSTSQCTHLENSEHFATTIQYHTNPVVRATISSSWYVSHCSGHKCPSAHPHMRLIVDDELHLQQRRVLLSCQCGTDAQPAPIILCVVTLQEWLAEDKDLSRLATLNVADAC